MSTRSVNKPLQPPRREPPGSSGRSGPPQRESQPLKILIATSEAIPFAKTGGLADVCGALPRALAELGHEPAVIMPAYRQALQSGLPIELTGVELSIPIGAKRVAGRLLKSHLPDSSVPVYLVQQDQYYDRPELYTAEGKDYIDNCERFVFFSRAVLEAIRLLGLNVDILHANDWQTGLTPAYLKIEYRGLPGYEQIATLFTIHNMAFQGQFWHWDMLLTGIDWKYFNWHQMEFFGHLNLMKTGLVFADSLNTVSPRYAQEIQSSPLGCGLEGVLSQRRKVLSGILNGVDYREWNPAADPHLPANYTLETVKAGKAACKAALQKELALETRPDVPLVGFVGRLTDQKGVDLIANVIQQWVHTNDLQWVILGTGDPKYHQLFSRLADLYPRKVAVRLEFADRLAHRIEAGGDMFLMPSSFEPCGLNQLYSLKYGTVPVVRATGGLADTIVDCTSETMATRTANGFSFREYSALALSDTLRRAWDAYAKGSMWEQLIATGMQQDWSWSRSAGQYVALYEETLARLHQTALV
jgi:starch synthase